MLRSILARGFERTLPLLILGIVIAFSLANNHNIASAAAGVDYNPFSIKVVDAETGKGIPLAELTTTNEITYVTDSAGYVAFFEPGLMNEDVWFSVESHGYSHTYDSFGSKGLTLSVTPGGQATIQMNRDNIAERLYRVTGQGIYKDSVILGLPVPIQDPLLGEGKVMGQDTVQTIVYKGKLYWFWGDTDKPSHQLGNFRTTGATSELPANGGLDPDVGVDLTYFTDEEGNTKKMVPQYEGDGNLFWVSGLMTTEDANGNEKMLVKYSNLNGLDDEVASGILIWNDENEEFSDRIAFDMNKRWKHPDGQSTLYEDNGAEYWLFNEPWPVKRVLNNYESITDMNSYESFTPLKPGTQYDGENTQLNRDGNGELVWEWRKDTPAISQQQEADLIGFGLMDEDEARFQLKGVDTGEVVMNHTGSVKWNEYRKVWTNIIEQREGTSFMGEIWYAEAPAPTGPWKLAKKIITHNETDFYNIARHDYFDKDNGREIYFEGTYVAMFGNVGKPTPYYDYNQIMYKLDLSDESLDSVKINSNPEPEQEDLALNKAVLASSAETAHQPAGANDGDPATRWASASSDPQWIQIDLGQRANLNKVILNWEVAYGSSYRIQVSDDAEAWTDVYSTTTGNGGIDQIEFDDTPARYVRMYGTARGTVDGFSLWDFEVYGSWAGEGTSSIAAPSSVNAGGAFEAAYKAEGIVQSVYAEDVAFNYDPAKLEYVSATEGDENVKIVDQTVAPGQIRFLLVNLDGNANRDTLKLQFKALATGQTASTTIQLNEVTLADADGAEFQLEGASHSLQIIADAQVPQDLNEDDKISIGDLGIVAAAYGKDSTSPDWEQIKKADFNNDGKIDLVDIAAMARQIVG